MFLEIFLIIFLVTIICEIIDSSLGMGYGTILSPFLILLGFPVLSVVPAILISQGLGGIIASIMHNKHKNFDLSIKKSSEKNILNRLQNFGLIGFIRKEFSDDFKTVFVITSLGVLATIFSTIIAVNISKELLTTYINLLVILMGLFILLKFSFKYSSKKMLFVGLISSFNKGLSGGGFGPIVTGCQIVLGKKEKNSVACTTACEPLICFTGFASYLLLNAFSDWTLAIILSFGAGIGGFIGPFLTKFIKKEKFRTIVGAIMLLLGVWGLLILFKIIIF